MHDNEWPRPREFAIEVSQWDGEGNGVVRRWAAAGSGGGGCNSSTVAIIGERERERLRGRGVRLNWIELVLD